MPVVFKQMLKFLSSKMSSTTRVFSIQHIIISRVCSKSKVRASAINSNLVVQKVANSKIEWFHCIGSQKSNDSIELFSKIEWFHGTTGTNTNAGPESNLLEV